MSGQIGALRVTLGANTANFEQGMRRAAQTTRRTGQDIERSYVRLSQSGLRAFSTLRIGAASVATALASSALIGFARDAFTWAADLSEAAQRLGVTVEQLQALRLEAEQTGASTESLERALSFLNRTLGQAKAGIPAAVQSFRAIGISSEQIESFHNAGQALPEVIAGLSRLNTQAEQNAAGSRIMGRGFSEVSIMMTQGVGAMDRWTAAAIRNGMITNEQAEQADRAADEWSRMSAALRVELAGAVASALPGLMALLRVIVGIGDALIRVIGGLAEFAVRLASGAPIVSALGSVQQMIASRGAGAGVAARMVLPALTSWVRPGTGGMDLDLSSSGGRSRRSNSEAERRQFQYEQELRDLRLENLRALKENTENIDEQNELQEQIVSLENEKRVAEVSFRQAQNEINDTQAAELMRRRGIVNETERIGRALEHNRQVQEQENERADQQEGYARDRLRSEADMAETMAERRRIELDLLRITIEQRRNALRRMIREAGERGDTQAAAVAQLELDNLGNVEARERRSILRNTRGPLASFLAELPLTAARAQEALESLAVNGLQAVTDGILDVITGARSMGDVFRNVVRQIIADLLRIQLQRSIIGPLANALGGLFGGGVPGSNAGIQGLLTSIPGRAAGGPVLPGRTYIVGEKGPELLRMGGTGGHVFANDNIGGAPGGRVVVELRSELLDARIAEGSGIVLARAYPGMKADIKGSIADGNRRRA